MQQLLLSDGHVPLQLGMICAALDVATALTNLPSSGNEQEGIMIFSSAAFILAYLPIVFFVYFGLNKLRMISLGKIWLVLASVFFYGYWSVDYIPLLIGSILFNFAVGCAISPTSKNLSIGGYRKTILALSITANLALLGYFKYANFFIENLNAAAGSEFALHEIILPLGISFYTFTQIAFLVDSYRGEAKEYDLINYALFVTFFPHLIAGPILHHKEMMGQFKSKWTWAVRYRNILTGLFIFSIGLFKKVMIADTFSVWADAGFSSGANHDFFSSWATSLSYTFQLYFDFSGYCDMAIGAALLFNIWLPINFNSPYKALDIQDFWRRWHMTLSRYLRDYLYIPLGGNRCSSARVYFNLMATFVLGGLWHGASWMFVIWGALHGGALVIHRMWKNLGMSMPRPLAWVVTFLFVNITWVFFRATSMQEAMSILGGMIDVRSISSESLAEIPTSDLAWAGVISDKLLQFLPIGVVANSLCYGMIAAAFLIISQKNSFELSTTGRIGNLKAIYMSILFCLAMYSTLQSTSTVFLYFNF
ncbi:MBOAT family O-acyltransferase [Pseudomonas aeruginosa]|uniref:MBOAT family O-acyltransferase n=3 Tax=Pseudomonas aeruginosa TaxID=287 RepID=UPI001CF69DE9|nr:MBOAT family protein [Pseudomonas aeruginosa]MCL9917302.1 MBOAT family protein [Pseudomonas aeruginosa]MCV6195006.1 MBOAT family protein [Pseudomonas aeruginosa]MEA8804610.1 MBOAT family protein [Pseudomonas aeruginosa]